MCLFCKFWWHIRSVYASLTEPFHSTNGYWVLLGIWWCESKRCLRRRPLAEICC